MNWLNEFASRARCDVSLGRMTWFRLGGPARWLVQPATVEELSTLVSLAREHEVPLKVLGCGANVLIRDAGFDGVVVRLDQPVFKEVRVDGSRVEVGGGVDLMPLARRLSEQGLCGLECMAGIPATVGGAVRMNAGGKFGSFGDVVKRVRVLGDDGAVEDWSRERVGFGYRKSELGRSIVLSATLELEEEDPALATERFQDCLDFKVSSQPLADKSAGCIFKNPPGTSAGLLIDRAGLKGTRCGGATISSAHANFIVVDRGATASDVLRLIDLVQKRVDRVHDTKLEVEIDIW